MTIDDESALAVLDKTALFATVGWAAPAAEAVKQTILAETSIGRDSDGNKFEDWSDNNIYSPSQARVRKKAGVTLSVKNLEVTGALKEGLQIREREGRTSLSVAESSTDKLNRIAHGLMYHPKWRYHMKFMDAGKMAYEAVMQAIKGAF